MTRRRERIATEAPAAVTPALSDSDHEPAAQTTERAPAFFWSGRPVYRCRVCGDGFERIENLAAVLQHEADVHAMPPPVVRESPILGPRGETLMVEEVTVVKVEE